MRTILIFGFLALLSFSCNSQKAANGLIDGKYNYTFKFLKVLPGLPSQKPYHNYIVKVTPDPLAGPYEIINNGNSLNIQTSQLMDDGSELSIYFNDRNQQIDASLGFILQFVDQTGNNVIFNLPDPTYDGEIAMP